jgi:hypothetical protein
MTDDRAPNGTGSCSADCALPVSLSFVVQCARDASRLRGRVEHIESGQSRRFASADELIAFVRKVLVAPDPTEATGE